MCFFNVSECVCGFWESICVCVWMCVSVQVSLHICLYVCLSICMFLHIYTCVWIPEYVWVPVCYLLTSLLVLQHICLCVSICFFIEDKMSDRNIYFFLFNASDWMLGLAHSNTTELNPGLHLERRFQKERRNWISTQNQQITSKDPKSGIWGGNSGDGAGQAGCA